MTIGRYAQAALAAVSALALTAAASPAVLAQEDSVPERQPAAVSSVLAAAVKTADVGIEERVRVDVARRPADGSNLGVTVTSTWVSGRTEAFRTLQAAHSSDIVFADVAQQVSVASSDPLLWQQWPLRKVTFDAVSETGQGVKVAVIDSGVDASHPDLAGQVVAGIDYVDGGDGRIDPHGHGTHVAGIIAASANNGIGIAGAAPNVNIVPVRALNETGVGWDTDVAAGIIYATDVGARVVNLSLGSVKDGALRDAVNYAESNGVLVVAAAGNARASGSPVTYPASYQEVLAVSAVDAMLQVASFSNAGSYVDVAAPGVMVLSTTEGSYSYMSGTSMAAPHVAASAALLVEAFPSVTPGQLRAALTSSAVDLGPAGKDNDFGWGLVNPAQARAALEGANSQDPPTSTPEPTPAPEPEPTPVPEPEPTPVPEPEPTPVPEPEPTPAPEPEPTPAPEPEPTPAPEPEPEPRLQATLNPTVTPTVITYGKRGQVTVQVASTNLDTLTGSKVAYTFTKANGKKRTVRRPVIDGAATWNVKTRRTLNVTVSLRSQTHQAQPRDITVYVAPKIRVKYNSSVVKYRVRPAQKQKVTLHKLNDGKWTVNRTRQVNNTRWNKIALPSRGVYKLTIGASDTLINVTSTPFAAKS